MDELLALRARVRELEERLAANEAGALPRALFESALDAMLLVDDDGVLDDANPAAGRLFGVGREQLLGRRLTDFVDPEAETEARFAALRAGKGLEAGATVRRPDGERWRVELRVTPNVLPGRHLAVLRDVSPRLEAERALRRSERRIRALGESEVFGFVIATERGQLLDANRVFLDLVGHREEELHEGRLHWTPLTPPENNAEFAVMQQEMRAFGRSKPRVRDIVARDGSRIPTLLAATYLDEEEEPLVVTFLVDLREQQRMSEALRATRTMLEALVEASPAALSVTDPRGRVQLWNPAAERVFGWTAAEVLGAPLPTAYEEDLRAHLEATGRGASIAGRRVTRWHKECREVEVLLSSAPLYDATGALSGVLELAVDITEQVRLEEQLAQALKMEAVGTLAGGIAHDFNNTLAAVLGLTSLVRSELPPHHAVQEDLEQIAKAAAQGVALTRQLLAFSRKQVLKPQVMEPNELIDGLSRMLRRVIGAHIEVVTELAPDIGSVRVDPGQLEQVIMNLAVNAKDAMPSGGRLTLATRREHIDAAAVRRLDLAPGDHVVIEVQDTGVGMDRATLSRIFEPFFTTKGQGKGTGLGLPMAYGVVKQSGGAIVVDSEPGRGARFCVYLPAFDAKPAAPSGPAPSGETGRGGETVLVAEDEPLVRNFVRRLLERSGYRVLLASHGQHALEVARAHPGAIDVLLTDVVMPHLGGRALAQALVAERPETRVIFMSGHAEEAFPPTDELPDGVVLLPKPFQSQDLLASLRAVIDAKGGARPPDRTDG